MLRDFQRAFGITRDYQRAAATARDFQRAMTMLRDSTMTAAGGVLAPFE
jgi:hypothetical protein